MKKRLRVTGNRFRRSNPENHLVGPGFEAGKRYLTVHALTGSERGGKRRFEIEQRAEFFAWEPLQQSIGNRPPAHPANGAHRRSVLIGMSFDDYVCHG
jgi:hypothetical protein